MTRFLFIICTLFVGFFVQLLLNHYLALSNTAPQILLLAVVAHGFLFGPVLAQVLGFCWGLMTDATGVHLFGLNAFLLTFIGYMAGQFRRRVAAERLTAQLVMAVAATALYGWTASIVYGIFDEAGHRFTLQQFVLEIVYNTLFIPVMFICVDRWTALWNIESERN
jgi:rod shape-determining protein MreD